MAEIIMICSNQFSPSGFASYTRPPNLKIGIASNYFPVTQSVKVRPVPMRLNVENFLQMFDEARNKNILVQASDFLNLQQQVVRPNFQLAFNYLPFLQSAYTGSREEASNTLALTQTVDLARGLANPLNLQQTATVNVIKGVRPSDTLALKSEVAVYKNGSEICGS